MEDGGTVSAAVAATMAANVDGLNFDELPPALLNAKNRALSDEVQRLQKEQKDVEKKLVEQRERKTVLEDHLRQVRLEVQNAQSLLEAKRSELHTEEHMKQLADRDLGRLKTDMKKFQNELADQHDRLNTIQNNIFRSNEKLDEFKLEMNWNQEELEQWILAQKQKEDDRDALSKYAKGDAKRIHDLELKVQKVSQDLQERKLELDIEVTETQAAQIQLDKTAEDFRQLHEERNALVRQWEDAIEAMRKRDDAIRETGERYAQGRMEVTTLQDVVTEKGTFLRIEEANNKEVEGRISTAERVVARLRDEYSGMGEVLRELEDEVQVVKNTLAKASNDLSSSKNEHRGLDNRVDELNARLSRARSQLDHQKEKLQLEERAIEDRTQQAADVDQLMKETVQREQSLDKELTAIKEQQYKRQERLHKLRAEENNYITEIKGIQAQHKNMRAKMGQLDTESFKQQELLYNLEFKIQLMERKVSRAMGERTEEEKRDLRDRIEKLQGDLDAVQAQHKMLAAQVKKVSQDRRSIERRKEDLGKKRDDIKESIVSLNLEITSCTTEQKQLLGEKQDLMVQTDLLQLQLKRLREIFNSKAEHVFTLESRRLIMESTMAEREKAISAHREILLGELRRYEDERHQIQKELTSRQHAVERLRKRYEILLARMRPIEGEEDINLEEMTQAQFIIRAAQKREELQRRGDELDSNLQQLQKEEDALIKALGMLNVRNRDFQSGFRKVTTGEDQGQKKALLMKEREATQALTATRREVSEQEQINQEMMNRLMERDEERVDLESQFDTIREQENVLVEQSNNLEKDIHRLRRQLNALATSIRDKTADVVEVEEHPSNEVVVRAPQEMDIKVVARREAIRDALGQLNDIVNSLAQTEDAYNLPGHFQNLLQKYRLQLPRMPSASSAGRRSMASARPGSAVSIMSRSSVQSRRSSISSTTSSVRAGRTTPQRSFEMRL